MKRFLTIFLSFVLCAFAWSGEDFSAFVPSGWVLIDKAQGDLAGEGREDAVLVIAQNDPTLIREKEDFESDAFNTNPRTLLILFQDKNGAYRPVLTHKTIIPPACDEEAPNLEDPFQSVRISKGRLMLAFGLWASSGTWSASVFTRIFRYEKETQRFRLIGSEVTDIHRATREGTNFSSNYLTGKEKITKTTVDDDDQEMSQVSWNKMDDNSPLYLDEIKDPLTLETLGK